MKRRLLRTTVLGFVLLGTLMAMAWFDVVPGGWFLRNLVEAPEVRSERVRKEHRADRMQSFGVKGTGDRAIVFLGSSTIEYWPLETTWPELSVLNRGIGSEPIRELVERLEDPRSALRQAKALVLYSGAVDFYALRTAPEDIAGQYAELLECIAAAVAPSRPEIVILGILPSRDLSGAQYRKLVSLNAQLFALARMRGLKFVDPLKPPLLCGQRRLSVAHSRDRNHLNAEGYAVLSSWLRNAAPELFP